MTRETVLQSVPAESSEPHSFSLFKDDLVSRSFAALGPLIPLLPYVIDLPEPWLRAIQEGKKLLH
ncbi:MAG: hypothetical protein KF814_06840 [Nitrospiraceae bacterium]|nr:hypothetical protein [Nitrospiraceae bacterium]